MILARDLPPGADALSSDNLLIFAPGALCGTYAPTAGRTTVVSKSPATGLFFKASTGGQWGPQMRYTGYDLLVVKGEAERPAYLVITDQGVTIEDASGYWGLDVRETTRRMTEDLNIPGVSIACIGPGGERRLKFASVMCSTWHAAARGGLGAVMGAKNLKAIAVAGTTPAKVAQVAAFERACQRAREAIAANLRCKFYGDYGTAGVILGVNETDTLPSYNFQQGHLPDAYCISGQSLTKDGYLVRRESCAACTISCKRYTRTKTWNAGAEAGGPEYETLAALGSGCGVTDMDVVLKANELCNLYGIDTISTGSIIAWAMECFEKGILKPADVEGLELTWGNRDAITGLIELMVARRGFGDVLAEGVRYAAQKLGHDSWKWAIEAKGLEQSGVETRMAKAYALAFATNPRGPDHLYGQPMAEMGYTPEARALVKKIAGDEKYAKSFLVEKKPELVRWHEDVFAMTDSLGLCSRATLSTYAITPEMMGEMFSAYTGVTVSEEKMFEAAQRIIALERTFCVQEGGGREKDKLPWRVMHEERPSKMGPACNSPEEIGKMLDRYYELRGWDVATGRPTKKLLVDLDLGHFVERLENRRELEDS